MRFPFIFLLIGFASCNFINDKGKRTRSFKLTEDSTFIGAWGGMLPDEQRGYLPSLSETFSLVFIYSKDNKIYVSAEPEGFDEEDTNEVHALNFYFSLINDEGAKTTFDESYVFENDTRISKEFTEYSSHGYEINSDNSLSYNSYAKMISKESKLEYYKFLPYYFKTIQNPEDHK